MFIIVDGLSDQDRKDFSAWLKALKSRKAAALAEFEIIKRAGLGPETQWNS